MSINFSPAMRRRLKDAPDHWSNCKVDATTQALRKRGLVVLRDLFGQKSGGMWQWRITDTGREVDGRDDAPTYDVTVWNDSTGDVVKTLYDATDDEVDEIRERYEDEPFMSVVVEER